MKISFNGALVEIADAPCNESGWLLGTGIFETIKTVNGAPYALALHLQRAGMSAKILGFNLPSIPSIELAVRELLIAEPNENGHLRVSFNVNGQWSAIHLPYQPLVVSAKIRIHPDPLMSRGARIKSYPYDQRLAILNEAKLLGFDEAIVFNAEGNISEGAVSNIMAQINGQWITPPISDGALPGIMRGLVIENCRVAIATIPISHIGDITSAFLLSSLRIAQPISSIEGRHLQVSQAFKEEIHAKAVAGSLG